MITEEMTKEMFDKLKKEPITLQAINSSIYMTNSMQVRLLGTLQKDSSKTYAYDVAGCAEVIWVGVRRIKIEAAS